MQNETIGSAGEGSWRSEGKDQRSAGMWWTQNSAVLEMMEFGKARDTIEGIGEP